MRKENRFGVFSGNAVEAPSFVWHKIPLGVKAAEEAAGEDSIAYWDMKHAGIHMLLAGTTGSGKTCLMINTAYQCALRGFEILVVDILKQGVEFEAFIETPAVATETAFDLESAARLLSETEKTVALRNKKIASNGAETWDELPENERLSPTLLIVEDFPDIAVPWGSGEPGKDSRARKELVRSMMFIAHYGRRAGVHILASGNWRRVSSSKNKQARSIASNMSCRALLGQADLSLTRTVFPNAETSLGKGAMPRGCGFLSADFFDAPEPVSFFYPGDKQNVAENLRLSLQTKRNTSVRPVYAEHP